MVLAGDVFYSQGLADRMIWFLRRARRAGASVLVGDPGRAFLPPGACTIARRVRRAHPGGVGERGGQADGRLADSVTLLFRTWDADVLPSAVTDPFGVRHIVVTRHAQVRAVLADPVTFRPDNALDAVSPMPVSALRVLAAHGFRLPPTLANNGGLSHPAIRAAVAEALHPARVAAQRPWLAAVVGERVARLGAVLDGGGTVDLYADLAADLPLLVLSRLVDLPPADTAVVKEFTRAALELFWAPVSGARQRRLAAVVGRFHTVLRAFAADGPGLAAALRADGRTRDEVVGALFFLLVAGQETTSQFLTLLMHRLVVDSPAPRRRVVRRRRGGAAPRPADRHLAAGGGPGHVDRRAAGRRGHAASCCGWPAPAATRRWSRRRTTSCRGSPAPGGISPSEPAPTAASALSCPAWRRR